MVSLLSRVIWTTWVSCSCKALSTCGQTIRKVTIKSRTWRASSPCRGTSSCTIRWFCFARSVRRTRMAMRNPHPTVSSTLWRYRQRFGLIYMILSDIYKQELVCGWTYMCDTEGYMLSISSYCFCSETDTYQIHTKKSFTEKHSVCTLKLQI